MIEGKTTIRTTEGQSKSRQVLGHLVNGTIVNFDEPTLEVFNPPYGNVIKHLEVGGKSAVEALSPPQKKRSRLAKNSSYQTSTSDV